MVVLAFLALDISPADMSSPAERLHLNVEPARAGRVSNFQRWKSAAQCPKCLLLLVHIFNARAVLQRLRPQQWGRPGRSERTHGCATSPRWRRCKTRATGTIAMCLIVSIIVDGSIPC